MKMFKSQEIGRGPAPNNNNPPPKIQALEHPRAQGFNKPFRGPNHPHSDYKPDIKNVIKIYKNDITYYKT